jgi:hypothetical protein
MSCSLGILSSAMESIEKEREKKEFNKKKHEQQKENVEKIKGEWD